MFQFIVQEIGVPRDKITHVAVSSQVMSLNITANLQPKMDYFVGDLKIPRKSLGRIVGAFPQLLTLNLDANLLPKVRFLSEELGIAHDELGKVIMRHPQLLGLSLEHNIIPTVAFLIEEALVPPPSLPTLITRCPSILSLSLSTNLRPTLAYLRTIWGDAQELGDAISVNPMLLTLSLEATVVRNVKFYKTELGFTKLTVARMMHQYPALLTLNIENNVKPKMALLVNGMGISLSKAAKLVASHPTVLARSRYSLWSCYKGLLTAGFTQKEAQTMILRNPRLLLYSSAAANSALEFVLALQRPPLLLPAATARALLARYPSLCSVRGGAARLEQVAAFFAQHGVSGSALSQVLDTYPQVLALSVERRLQATLRYLVEQLRLTPAETTGLISRTPGVLGLHPKRTLKPKIEFLLDDVGLEPIVLKKVLLRAPQLLHLSLAAKLEVNLKFLLDDVGVPRARLPRVIEKAPSLLCLSSRKNMLPIIEFLADSQGVGIDRVRLGTMIALQPQILMSSLELKIKPCLDFLFTRLHLTPQQARKVLQGNPSLLGFSVPLNLEVKLAYYCRELNITGAALGKMCWSFPPLLSLSIDGNIKLKLRYLFRYMNVSKDVIVAQPQLLAYSLRGRIYPRFKHINQIGAQGQASLSSLLSIPDNIFYDRFPSTYKRPKAYNISFSDLVHKGYVEPPATEYKPQRPPRTAARRKLSTKGRYFRHCAGFAVCFNRNKLVAGSSRSSVKRRVQRSREIMTESQSSDVLTEDVNETNWQKHGLR